MEEDAPKSPIAHLLWGISWEGKTATKKYRNGGRRVEEVLTTEVLMGLEFLPRRPFLKRVVDAIQSGAPSTGFLKDEEVDSLRFLPEPIGNHALRPSAPTHQAALDVQFDAMAETQQSRIFIEAKRIGTSSFQEEQLARTFIIALRESHHLLPRVLFIIGEPPPVKAKKQGRVSIKEGIINRLPEVYEKTEGLYFSLDEAKEMIDECVGWVTWQSISEAVSSGMRAYSNQDTSTYTAIQRIAGFVEESVKWHQ